MPQYLTDRQQATAQRQQHKHLHCSAMIPEMIQARTQQ